MIRMIEGHKRGEYVGEMAGYHKLRAKKFGQRLGWPCAMIGEMEIDGYDCRDPLYLLSISATKKVVGGLRLLPTMGDVEINDTFLDMLPEGKPVSSPTIWEASRVVIDHARDRRTGQYEDGNALADLMLAMNTVAMSSGVTHIVMIYDVTLRESLLQVGAAGDIFGVPKMIGEVPTYAAFLEVGDGLAAKILRQTGAVPIVLTGRPIEMSEAS